MYRDQPAVILLENGVPSQIISYGRLFDDAVRRAAFIRESGVEPQDVVLLLFEHGYDQITAFLGALAHGAVPVLLPPPSMRGSDASDLDELAASAMLRSSSNEREAPREQQGSLSISRIQRRHSPSLPEDASYVQLTSGTTGRPRPAIISNESVLRHLEVFAGSTRCTTEDVFVGWLPLNHDMGLFNQLLLPIFCGAVTVMLSPRQWIQHPLLLLNAVDTFKGSVTFMPNFGLQHCVRAVKRRPPIELDLGSWRLVGSGAEIISHRTLQEFSETLAPYGFQETALLAGYGMAEAVLGITHTKTGQRPKVDWIGADSLERALPASSAAGDSHAVVSCGLPLDGVDVAIVDGHGTHLGSRQIGKIIVRSEALFSGYLNNPELTAAKISDGWFHTGDHGYLDEDQLYVCGRIDDVINIAGRKVLPELVEEVAARILGADGRYVVAFGVFNQASATESLVIICELRNVISEDQRHSITHKIVDAVRRVTGITPTDLRLLESRWIEHTTNGKISRSACRSKYEHSDWMRPEALVTIQRLNREHASNGRQEPDAEATYGALADLCRDRLGVVIARPDDDFFEIGCDSIRILEFIAQLEDAIGRPLPVDTLLQRPTLQSIHEALMLSSHAPSTPSGNGTYCSAAPVFQPLRRFPVTTMIAKSLPISLWHTLIRGIAEVPLLQKYAFADRGELVRSVAMKAGLTQCPSEAIRESIFGNALNLLYSRGARPQVEVVAGESHLMDALREDRGLIVLVSHTVCSMAVGAVLSRLTERPVCAVRMAGIPSPPYDIPPKEWHVRSLTSQLYGALRCLEKGGIAVIAGDGCYGQRGIRIPFHGRIRRFGVGFAELATRTNAVVLPVFTTVGEAARVRVHVTEPIPSGLLRDSVQPLVLHYARLLSAWWVDHLGSIKWKELERFSCFPELGNGRVSSQSTTGPKLA